MLVGLVWWVGLICLWLSLRDGFCWFSWFLWLLRGVGWLFVVCCGVVFCGFWVLVCGYFDVGCCLLFCWFALGVGLSCWCLLIGAFWVGGFGFGCCVWVGVLVVLFVMIVLIEVGLGLLVLWVVWIGGCVVLYCLGLGFDCWLVGLVDVFSGSWV